MNILRPPRRLEKWWLIPLQAVWFVTMSLWLILRTLVLRPIAYIFSLPFRPIFAFVNLATHWAGDKPSKRWGVLFVGSLILSIVSVLPFIDMKGEIALGYIGSLLIHELFHGYGYYRAKVPFYIVFIGFLGAAAVSSDINYNKMRHWDKSIMLLLGPTGSLLVSLFWWVLSIADSQNALTYHMLAGFNLTLVLFNMIALGGLDGGRIYLSMMASIREEREKYVALVMIVVSTVVLSYAFIHSFRFELILFFLLWMIIGFIKTMGKDNPTDYLREPAMRTKETLIIMALYLSLFTVSTFLYLYFPDWSPLVVVHPFITTHLPEIAAVLFIVGLYVLSTDISNWKTSHPKYKLPVEIVVLLLLTVLPFIPVVLLAQNNVSIWVIWGTVVVAYTLGNLSMRCVFRWTKVRAEILSDVPVEPLLDVYAVVGDTV